MPNKSLLFAHHYISALLGLLVQFHALLASDVSFEDLPGTIDGLKGILGPLLVLLVLVRMHENGQTPVPLLDLVQRQFRIDLEDLEERNGYPGDNSGHSGYIPRRDLN